MLRLAFFVILLLASNGFAAIYIVTRNDDRNLTCISGTDCSLREAIKATNSTPADDIIRFRPNVGTIMLDGVEIAITNNGKLAINGNGADIQTIDGGPGENRIFYIVGANVTVRSLSLTGGNAAGTVPLFNLQGGAIYVNGGSLTLERMNISGNTATSGGLAGAVFYFAGFGTPVNRIISSTFSYNQTATSCGALFNSGSNLTIVNSTFSGNSAQTGGAICNDGALSLRNVTISENIGIQGGGGLLQGQSQTNLANTIIAGNIGPVGSPEILSNGGVVSLGNNLIGDSPGDSTNTGSPIAYQINDIRDVPPQLGPLLLNGGQVPSRILNAGSPAIDAGSNVSAVDPSNAGIRLARDARDFARIVGAVVDIGAIEFGSANLMPLISGRVTIRSRLRARGIVALTDVYGNVFSTHTNQAGTFRLFLPQAGRNKIASVSSKQAFFQFNWIYVSDDMDELNFVDF